MKACSVVGCFVEAWAQSYCAKHYRRNKKYGNPNITKRSRWMSIDERINACSVPMKNGCIGWSGVLDRCGYAKIFLNYKNIRVARHLYAEKRGKIRRGFVIDHLCRNRECINVDHLECVTVRENTLRGIGFSAINARKKFCKAGHEFVSDNIYKMKKGRACKKCRLAAVIKYQKKKREEMKQQIRS